MKTRILIADDHPIMLSGVEAILQNSDFEVVAKAANGSEALDAIDAVKPEIAVLDVNMAGRSGMDVLRTLRSKGDLLPVVLLTAELDDADLLEAIQLGVSGILLKDGAQMLLTRCLEEVRRGERWVDKALLQRAVDATLLGPTLPGAAIRALAPREKAVVALVARGLRNREIAAELGLTEGTVKVYLYRIYEKLGVGNRTELALLVREKLTD